MPKTRGVLVASTIVVVIQHSALKCVDRTRMHLGLALEGHMAGVLKAR